MTVKKRDYKLIIGVCQDNGVIIDITYDGILDNLNEDDLKDVYLRLKLLKKHVKGLILNKIKERLKTLWTSLWSK